MQFWVSGIATYYNASRYGAIVAHGKNSVKCWLFGAGICVHHSGIMTLISWTNDDRPLYTRIINTPFGQKGFPDGELFRSASIDVVVASSSSPSDPCGALSGSHHECSCQGAAGASQRRNGPAPRPRHREHLRRRDVGLVCLRRRRATSDDHAAGRDNHLHPLPRLRSDRPANGSGYRSHDLPAGGPDCGRADEGGRGRRCILLYLHRPPGEYHGAQLDGRHTCPQLQRPLRSLRDDDDGSDDQPVHLQPWLHRPQAMSPSPTTTPG